jgi:hypothetical protein
VAQKETIAGLGSRRDTMPYGGFDVILGSALLQPLLQKQGVFPG